MHHCLTVCFEQILIFHCPRTRLSRLEETLEHQTALVRQEKETLISIRESSRPGGSDETSADQIDRCNESVQVTFIDVEVFVFY
jgi:hypothetical protein